jgi:hypothetical protein
MPVAREHRKEPFERAPIPVDLAVVCLWLVFGLLPTLVLALRFGTEVGEALAMAG